jgi:predicted RNA-binding protein
MCEFNVIFNGKIQMKEVIYAKVDGSTVTVRNVMGEPKEFQNVKISEVDVANQRMVLVAV